MVGMSLFPAFGHSIIIQLPSFGICSVLAGPSAFRFDFFLVCLDLNLDLNTVFPIGFEQDRIFVPLARVGIIFSFKPD